MMKLKNLVDNKQLVNELISKWLKSNEYTLHDQFRISSNSVYMFNYENVEYIIRFALKEEKDVNQVNAEVEYVNYLRLNEFPVVKFLQSKIASKFVELVNTEWGNYAVNVYERIEGISVEEVKVDINFVQRIGSLLAKLHNLSEEFTSNRVKRESYADKLGWMKSFLNEYIDQDKAKAEVELLISKMDTFEKNQNNFGLTHFDFELDNLLYNEETDSISVIDFDDSMYHWYCVDIIQTIESIYEEVDDVDFSVLDELLLGYQKNREIDSTMLENIDVFKRFGKLLKYVRCLRALSEQPEERPEWMLYLIERLKHLMKDYSIDFGKGF